MGLASLYCLRMLGLFMVLPLFAVYAQELAGATPASIGLALGAYGLTQAALQVPLGWLSAAGLMQQLHRMAMIFPRPLGGGSPTRGELRDGALPPASGTLRVKGAFRSISIALSLGPSSPAKTR